MRNARRRKKKNRNFYVGQHSQVLQFIQKCQPNYNQMKPKYETLCVDLQIALQRRFPLCKVHRFGSTVTGLYFTDSDVDIFVELDEKNPSFNAVESINNAKSVLEKHGHIFREVLAIPKAKTPICKFLHHPTKIRCDFNFKSVMGVYNSWFVHYYLSLDTKLGHMMMVIKYWAKMKRLVNTSDFSNYSLSLMFIFYLQQEYSMPSVGTLQTVDSINVQDDWNVGIDYSFNFTSQSLKESSAEDILFGFFDYYATFNYQFDIICPFLGRPITRAEFVRFDSLQPLFKLYLLNADRENRLQLKSEICLQDPFEHTNNVTGRVKKKCLKKFITLCQEARQIFEKRPVSCRALDDLFGKKSIVAEPNRNNNRKVQPIGKSAKFNKMRKIKNEEMESIILLSVPSVKFPR